jgi:hypothetical protein
MKDCFYINLYIIHSKFFKLLKLHRQRYKHVKTQKERRNRKKGDIDSDRDGKLRVRYRHEDGYAKVVTYAKTDEQRQMWKTQTDM